jgi:hypothetical protein
MKSSQLFTVTFERYSPESSEHGDALERGFVSQDQTLRDALEDLGYSSDYPEPSNSPGTPRWITLYGVNDGTREYYEEGITENRSLHFHPALSGASVNRIIALLS